MEKLYSVLTGRPVKKPRLTHDFMCECRRCERSARLYIRRLQKSVKMDARKEA